MNAPENDLISRRLPQNPNPAFLSFRVPAAGLRLSAEEWRLIVSALSAYRHNQAYRPLYEKLTTQTS